MVASHLDCSSASQAYLLCYGKPVKQVKFDASLEAMYTKLPSLSLPQLLKSINAHVQFSSGVRSGAWPGHPSFNRRPLPMLLYRRLCGWRSSLRVAHRLALDRLSHGDAVLRVLLPLLSCLLVLLVLLTILLALLTVLLALLSSLLVLLIAGASRVPIHGALLLLKALIHEAGDEAEGRQEDEEQDDCDHACAGHPLALTTSHLHVAIFDL